MMAGTNDARVLPTAATAASAVESLFGMTLARLQSVATEADLPLFGGRQLADWLYRKHADSFDGMLNLPGRARRWLAERYAIHTLPPTSVAESTDGTRKYLFKVAEGRSVEAAFIPEGERSTLCLSVQVGCKMGCLFCMTGRQGFQGHLSPGEILNQYESLPERDQLTNIVFMGMGEPLDNLEAVLNSLEVLSSDYGYGLSPARITVSSVGLLPALKTFLERSRCHLAISLHSPFEEERRALMPVENVYPLREILETLRKHLSARRTSRGGEEDGPPAEETRPRRRGRRRVSFEYIMFEGLNDTRLHARELVRILQGIQCRVNLIPFHPIPGSPLKPSPRDQIERFQSWLKAGGIMTTVRASRGLDIAAACGLLSTRRMMALEPADF